MVFSLNANHLLVRVNFVVTVNYAVKMVSVTKPIPLILKTVNAFVIKIMQVRESINPLMLEK